MSAAIEAYRAALQKLCDDRAAAGEAWTQEDEARRLGPIDRLWHALSPEEMAHLDTLDMRAGAVVQLVRHTEYLRAELAEAQRCFEQVLNERDMAHEAMVTARADNALLLRRLSERNRAIRVLSKDRVDFDQPERQNAGALLAVSLVYLQDADHEAQHYAYQLRQLWRRCKEAELDNVHLRSWLYRIGTRLNIQRAVTAHWLVAYLMVVAQRDGLLRALERELRRGMTAHEHGTLSRQREALRDALREGAQLLRAIRGDADNAVDAGLVSPMSEDTEGRVDAWLELPAVVEATKP